MPLEVRRARPGERDSLLRFYERLGYAGHVSNDATAFVAELDGQMVGLLRLEQEFGATVLRGMRVSPEYQRQGIGSRLLQAVADHLGTDPCYCVPYSHLTAFYGQIGFVELSLDRAPAHLRERVGAYRARGRDVLLMLRHSTPGHARNVSEHREGLN